MKYTWECEEILTEYCQSSKRIILYMSCYTSVLCCLACWANKIYVVSSNSIPIEFGMFLENHEF